MKWTITFGLLMTCLLTATSSSIAQQADSIYHNGSIVTMAGSTPAYVEALAVKDGKNRVCRNENGRA